MRLFALGALCLGLGLGLLLDVFPADHILHEHIDTFTKATSL